MLGQYFEKRYIFANSVAFCGYSFAQMTIPRLAQFLIEVGSVLCCKYSDPSGVGSWDKLREERGCILHVALPNGSMHDQMMVNSNFQRFSGDCDEPYCVKAPVL